MPNLFSRAAVPRYRRWLSYLWEQTLEVTASEYNDYLEVCLVGGRLQLVAQEAIYSFGDYYLNFRKLFERMDLSRLPAGSEVLVLGLGLGSIPELLETRHGCRFHYTAVEIDPVIIELASYYSLPSLSSPVAVVQADALSFVARATERYHLICIDVFQDATIPSDLSEGRFLERCKQLLYPGGILVFNRLAASVADRQAATAYYRNVFAPAFAAPTYYDSGGNYLLVNDARCLSLSP